MRVCCASRQGLARVCCCCCGSDTTENMGSEHCARYWPGISPYLCGSKPRGAWLITWSGLYKLTSRHCWAASPQKTLGKDPLLRSCRQPAQSSPHACRTEVPVSSMGGHFHLHTMSHPCDGWNLPAWLLHLSVFLPQCLRACTVTLQHLDNPGKSPYSRIN